MAGLVEHALRAERAAEHWLPVPGYEGHYEVSNRGRVRSLDRTIINRLGRSHRLTGRVLKPRLSRPGLEGRWFVDLARENVSRHWYVHALMLAAFVGPRPEGMEGCHNDGDRDNNVIGNLRWDTHSANMYDRVRHGTHHQVNKTHCPQGHEYTPENTVACNQNSRRCLICRGMHSRRWAREVGTPRKREAQMALRGDLFGANANTLKTHCKHGHPLSGENLYIHPSRGFRDCRSCRREASRRAAAKKAVTQ